MYTIYHFIYTRYDTIRVCNNVNMLVGLFLLPQMNFCPVQPFNLLLKLFNIVHDLKKQKQVTPFNKTIYIL